ncbi:hypothetical protein INT47_001545 [Mucor saturninus]|uniref:Uncharacterized protein n=1 Tax=Mucor saturninus TaxID=64648 RepID=A0A8H7QTJ7_9FUNG|nr:hypothetical protein INT47_001545 [Mucor saturninus]
MSIACNSSPNITAICSPQSSTVWYAGSNYDIIWDSKHHNYNNTETVDIEINYLTKANSTETFLFGFSNIPKNASNFKVNITNDWFPPNIPLDQLMYDIYLLPHNINGNIINDTALYKPVTFSIMTPPTISPPKENSNTPEDITNPDHSSGLNTTGIVLIAVASVLIILVFLLRKKIFKPHSGANGAGLLFFCQC